MKISTNIKAVKVSNIEVYELTKKWGSLPLSNFEKEETKAIGALMVPCGFMHNGKVLLLTLPEELEKAELLGIEEIDVQIIEELNINEVPRIMNYQRFLRSKKSYAIIAAMSDYLEGYLTNDDYGKEWAKLIPGEKTRDKVGELVGYGGVTIQKLKAINLYAPHLFASLDDRTMSLYNVMKEVGKIKNEKDSKTSNKSFGSLKIISKDTPAFEWFTLNDSDMEKLAEGLIDYQQKKTIIRIGFEDGQPALKIDTKAGDNTITMFPQPLKADEPLSAAA